MNLSGSDALSKYRRVFVIVVAIIAVVFLAIQVIPVVGRTNPPVQSQLKWISPEGEQLARAACFDCHSNETKWPWYTYVAPVSWLTVHDVQEGRQKLNFSDVYSAEFEVDEMVEQIERGEMPPRSFLLLHPEARLTDQQKQTLVAALQSVTVLSAPVSGEGIAQPTSAAPQGDADDDD